MTHKNLTIEAGSGPFVGLDPAESPAPTKLKALVDALNALQVPATDIIDIIQDLSSGGWLYGHVIIQ